MRGFRGDFQVTPHLVEIMAPCSQNAQLCKSASDVAMAQEVIPISDVAMPNG